MITGIFSITIGAALPVVAIGGTLYGFIAFLKLRRLDRPVAPRWTVNAALVAATGAVFFTAGLYAGHGFWLVAAAHAMLALVPVGMLEVLRERSGGRVWLLPLLAWPAAAWQSRRPGRAGDQPRPMTLTAIRAEYAQTVLDDARTDRHLAALIDDLAEVALRLVCRSEVDMPAAYAAVRATMRRMILTRLANQYVNEVTEPGVDVEPSGYLHYSQPMLFLTAVCQLADSGRRLRTV